MASLLARPCTRRASRATRPPKIATSSSPLLTLILNGSLAGPPPGYRPKTHRRFHQLSDAWCDADQKVGGWLFHRGDLDDAGGGLFRSSLSIEQRVCAIAPLCARYTAAFNRRYRVQADSRKRLDVSGNRQRRLQQRPACRGRQESIVIGPP